MLPYIVTTDKKANAAEFVNTMVTTYAFVMSAGTLALTAKTASTALKIWRGATTLVAFYDVVALNQKALDGIKSIGNGDGAKFVVWYERYKDYYNYGINQVGSQVFEKNTISPTIFMESDFWKKFKDGALLWDQVMKHAGLNKYVNEEDIKAYKTQFEMIKNFDPNEKIVD